MDVYEAGRAMFDLSRLRDEVDALADAKAEVALLYSNTSLIWQPGHDVAVKRGWTALANLGLAATFVTDLQLQEGRAADVKVILLPRSSYLKDATVAALAKFVEGGGALIALGGGRAAVRRVRPGARTAGGAAGPADRGRGRRRHRRRTPRHRGRPQQLPPPSTSVACIW